MRDNGLVKALALATQLGFAVACPLLAFIAGGAWLDNRLGTVPWLMMLGVLLGVLAAGGALYQVTTLQSRRRSGSGTGQAPYKVERDGQGAGTNVAAKRKRNGSGNR